MHVGRPRTCIARFSVIPFFCIALTLCLCASAFAATALPESISNDIKGGYFHRALDQLQAIKGDHANDAAYQFALGEALLGSNQTDDALKAMQAAVKIDSSNADYHRGLGNVYGVQAMRASIFSQYGLARKTLHEYQKAVKLAPDNVAAHVSLTMYYLMAPSIVGGGADKAHAQIAILGRLDPVQALLMQAREAVGDKDAKQAETLFRQAAAKDESTDSLNALGFFLGQQKRYDDALQAFQAATAKDAKDYLAWYQLGRIAGLAHAHYDQGVAALKRYLLATEYPDHFPPAAWAHFRLGSLYEDQGEIKLAQSEYQQADKLKGDDKDLAKELSQKKF